MFEDMLQPTLSELMDGIEFFEENTRHMSSKKYLSMFTNSRTKVLSFVKSFLIKLFNKEYNFVFKNFRPSTNILVDSFYPKSKIKFITNYLHVFPQFKRHLKYILMTVKESSGEEEAKLLESR